MNLADKNTRYLLSHGSEIWDRSTGFSAQCLTQLKSRHWPATSSLGVSTRESSDSKLTDLDRACFLVAIWVSYCFLLAVSNTLLSTTRGHTPHFATYVQFRKTWLSALQSQEETLSCLEFSFRKVQLLLRVHLVR